MERLHRLQVAAPRSWREGWIVVKTAELAALEEENARLREALNAVKSFLDPWRLTAPPFKPGQYNAAITLVLAALRAKEASNPE